MRQAGRVLPEYRALKEKHSFLELVRTPELATEVTLQPIDHIGGMKVIFEKITVKNVYDSGQQLTSQLYK